MIAQIEPLTTARALRGPFDYRLGPELRDGAVDVGSLLVVPFGRREVLGVVVGLAEHSEVAEQKLLAPLRVVDWPPSPLAAPPGRSTPLAVPVDLVALAEWIAAEYCSTVARALRLVLPPGSAAKLAAGTRRRRAVRRPRHLAVGSSPAQPPPLTQDQRAVLDELRALLRATPATAEGERGGGAPAGNAPARLLHGITGSGKTEVYLQAAAIALGQGRGAIVLVPEIALTPQIVGRFLARFGDTVAVLHSGMTPAQRREEWRRLHGGEARVCVGPRSAVFAPIERLGLIVVDEEHEASYKHEGDPRYDARDVAAWRARWHGALLLVGSATPRPESVEALTRLRLPRRVDGGPLPEVRVLDMCDQTQGLHPETAQALAEVRRGSGKAIVLLNRRGWSNFLSCRSCGRVWSCPQCDVALVLHRGRGLACHHCGHREELPPRCSCGSSAIARHGAGTERLQHDLAAALGAGEGFPIFRLDADALAPGGIGGPAADAARAAAAAKGEGGGRDVGALLREFHAAPAGVLVGTQMVAKGHDFPDVRLGVVLDADATLRFPDFRAEERTFALIAQLAGRVGRGGDGRVLVQTLAPRARAIVHAARHDSEGFLAGELERRAELRYPPYGHLVRIVCSAPQAARAQAAASAIRGRLHGRDLADAGASTLGPASLFRLRGQERRMLLVKARERRAAVRAIGAAVEDVAGTRGHAGVSFSVDVDPQ
ncbi:MAG TPA: primosomal protein N' [Solirubrobacteraceae bacterium]|nr:primosomal protein N' [Solirubrobacteraceae bacterium]